MSERRDQTLEDLLAASPDPSAFAAVCRHIDRGLHRDAPAQAAAVKRARAALVTWPDVHRLATPTAAARMAAGKPRPADALARHVSLRKTSASDLAVLGSALNGSITMLTVHLVDGAADGQAVLDGLCGSPLARSVEVLRIAAGHGSAPTLSPLIASAWPKLRQLDFGGTRMRLDIAPSDSVELVKPVTTLVLRNHERWADAPLANRATLDRLLAAASDLDQLVLGRVPNDGSALDGLASGRSLTTFSARGWPIDDQTLTGWTRLGERLRNLTLTGASVTGVGIGVLFRRAHALARLRVHASVGCGDELCRAIATAVDERRQHHPLERVSLRVFGECARPITRAGAAMFRASLPADVRLDLESAPGVSVS